LGAELFDSASMHSTSVNNSRITVPVTGLYIITGYISWDFNATGYRRVQLRLNGTIVIAQTDWAAAGSLLPSQSICTLYLLTANDYVEVCGTHTRGANLNAKVGSYLALSLLSL
jgi:hypothetical protein